MLGQKRASFGMPGRIQTAILVGIVLLCILSACGGAGNAGNTGNTASSGASASGGAIQVVAAENFYGDIVKQLGGSHVAVTSILSDPNVDPHAYESNVQNAILVSKAQLVIANGGGYDDWMDKLLSASPSSSRVVLKGFDLATHKLPDNVHVWYGFDNAPVIAQAIVAKLKGLDQADAATFDSNLQQFDKQLQVLQQKVSDLKAKYARTPVGLTETIFLYQSEPIGLKMLTPFEFQKAVAEGNDPPADTVVTVTNQVAQKQIQVLIYNQQTSTPITTQLQNAAKARNIPIVPVTETMPAGKNYQTWMMNQLNVLEQALHSSTGK